MVGIKGWELLDLSVGRGVRQEKKGPPFVNGDVEE